MAASSQQLQAEVVVQVLGRGSLLGQDARPPGVPGPAPWLRCIPSREPQHSVAPTSLLCCGQAVLFQAGLGVLLHVCLLGSALVLLLVPPPSRVNFFGCSSLSLLCINSYCYY